MTTPGFRRVPPPESDSAGFMLIESVVVLAVMGVILAMFFGILANLTNAGQRVEALVNNQAAVRFGLDQMQRDLRAANPLDVLPTTGAYTNQIRIELGPIPGIHQYIRWRYDTSAASPTYETLFRQVMSGPASTDTVLSQQAVITRVRNVETGAALFTYYDSHNGDLVANSADTPANVANCAVRVHIQISSDAQPGPQPFSENVDAELRNRLPGGMLGCPT